MENDSYKKWEEKYYYEKVINMDEYFNEADIKMMKKLGVNMNYTKFEFERIKGAVIDAEANFPNLGVSEKDYDSLLEKFDKISERFF